MTNEYVVGNQFVRQPAAKLAKGQVVNSHDHNFGHMTYFPAGKWLCERLDGPNGNIVKSIIKTASEGFNWVFIPAGVFHRLTALEDNSFYQCIYSHRIPQALVEQMGVDEEYDALMKRVIEMANAKFAAIVQEYDGWTYATM